MFETFYLIINGFSTYIILYAFSLTLGKRKSALGVYCLTFLAYFLVSSLVYLLFDTPLLNIICNIALMFVMTFNYEASITKRIIVALLFFVFMAAIESIVVMVYNMLDLPHPRTAEMSVIWGMAISKLLSLILCGTILRRLDLKNRMRMTVKQVLSVSVVAIGILVLTYVLITLQYDNTVLELISITSLFVICIFIFNFVNITSKEFYEKEQKKLLEMKSDSYLNELTIVNKAQNDIRFLKHDIANHLNTIQALIIRGDMAKAQSYIQSISKKMNSIEKVSNTNIAELDSIINFKVSCAHELDIKVHASIQIKEGIQVSPQDYISIIGNLFDNAIEAVNNKHIENRCIRFTIGSINGLLVIVIENPYHHTVLKSNGRFLTTKRRQKDHGYGLLNVETIVRKYNGTMHISYEKDFIVEISMINK